MINDRLKNDGYECVLTTEPTKFNTGLLIRELIKEEDKDPCRAANRDTFAWFMDRAEHNMKVVEPALESGKMVVSDRNYLSTIAYQISLNPNLKDLIFYILNNQKKNGYIKTPDISLVLDIPIAEYERRQKEKNKLEKFETSSFQKKVKHAYLNMKNYLADEEIRVLDGTMSVKDLNEEIYKKYLLKAIKSKKN